MWDKHCRFYRASFDDHYYYDFESLIDREREFYFFPFENEIFEEDTVSNVNQYLLVYKGESIFIKLKENCKGILTPRTYTIVWDMVSVTPQKTENLDYTQILILIKEVLSFERATNTLGLNVKKYRYIYNF